MNRSKGAILVVDDTPAVIDFVRATLEREGYRVFVATDGTTAVQRAADTAPELILLDIMMTGIDGLETCRRLKAQNATSAIPVIFLSALDAPLDKVKGFEVGGVDYVPKPVEAEELLARVHTHVTLSRLQRELQDTNRSLEARVAQRTQELARVNRTLRLLSDCNQMLVRATGESQLLQQICHLLVELGGYPFVWIGFTGSGEAKTIQPVAWEGREEGYLAAVKHNWSDEASDCGPVGEALRSGRMAIAADPASAPDSAWRTEANRRGFVSLIALPLLSGDRRLGVLSIFAAERSAFQDAECALLEELANDLAYGIASLRLREEHETASRIQAAVYRISEAAQTAQDLKELFISIHAVVGELMPARNFYVALIEDGTDQVTFPYFEDEFDQAQDSRKMAGLTGWVFRNGRPLLATPEVARRLLAASEIETLGALPVDWLGVPLKDRKGRTIGVMAVQTYNEAIRLTASHQEVLQFVSSQVAMGIERKRAQDALRESEERFRALYHDTPSMFFTLDDQFAVVSVNGFGASQLGYEADELRGQSVLKVFPESTHAKVIERLRHCFAHPQRVHHWQAQKVRKDGSTLYVEETAQVVVDDQERAHALIVCQDVTERVQAEERVKQQAALLDQTQDAIFVADLDSRVRYRNSTAARLYDLPVLEAPGPLLPALMFPNEPERAAEAAQATLHTGRWSGEIRRQIGLRQINTVESRWFLVRNALGQQEAFLIINTDISERKLLEERFFRAQRLDSLGTLASGIAHDLNNILTPITLSATLLGDSALDSGDTELVDVIRTSAERGTNIVRQMLILGRDVESQFVEFQPLTLLKEVVRIVGETFPKSIDLQPVFSEKLWTIKGDATQIHQVLLNLCINARDAMPRGGRLTLTAENVVLDEGFTAQCPEVHAGPHVVFGVDDTGEGIPPEIMDRVFEPFFTTKTTGTGTGLGLSSSASIVRNHGGTIQLSSHAAEGTQFRVYIPAFVAEPTSSPPPAKRKILRGQGESLLVVDDEEAVRGLVARTFAAAGYRVIAAVDGADALVLYRQNVADIRAVVTDIMMPAMDGFALIAALRQIAPTLPIIATSGVQGHRDEVVKPGVAADLFLPKPFSQDELLSALQTVLERAASQSSTSEGGH